MLFDALMLRVGRLWWGLEDMSGMECVEGVDCAWMGWMDWDGIGVDGLHARKAIVWSELMTDFTCAFLDKRSALFNDS